MHFFYLDETGDTGSFTPNSEQPVFVLGGISVSAQRWNTLFSSTEKRIRKFFEGKIPKNFELHSCDLLSPNGEGFFEGYEIEDRVRLASDLIDIIIAEKHAFHFIVFDKTKELDDEDKLECLDYNSCCPWLLAFDYMITHANEYTKCHLGSTVRSMILFDVKDEHKNAVEEITRFRKYEDQAQGRIKWIVEFSHPVDSQKNPMIQLADLAILCIRRFYEIEYGHRDSWPTHVKRYYTEIYEKIDDRLKRKSPVERTGKKYSPKNELIKRHWRRPSRGWKTRYKDKD